ncbi:MAG: hypothetical protein Q9M94_01945 [Candidatus Gracilibacteria bacterium]|nr:hypothetical protein [Candidatus Gracilibacteria bacterium]MDQ7023754.1 hypothetical protein [Candidatus Gracilibacteria bacterium]
MSIDKPKFVEQTDENIPTINENIIKEYGINDGIVNSIKERIQKHPELLDSPEEILEINKLIQKANDSFDPVEGVTKAYSKLLEQIKGIFKEEFIVKPVATKVVNNKSYAQNGIDALVSMGNGDRYNLDNYGG